MTRFNFFAPCNAYVELPSCHWIIDLFVSRIHRFTHRIRQLTTGSGTLFKHTAPIGVKTTGRSENEINCRDRRISLQSVADRSKIQNISSITLIPSNSDSSESRLHFLSTKFTNRMKIVEVSWRGKNNFDQQTQGPSVQNESAVSYTHLTLPTILLV